jgi:hypothetical protein
MCLSLYMTSAALPAASVLRNFSICSSLKYAEVV